MKIKQEKLENHLKSNISDIVTKTIDVMNSQSENEDTKALRYNKGKNRHDLLHPQAIEDLVKVLTIGANKYADRNWEMGMSWSSVLASLKRHLNEFEKSKDYDAESGLLHIAHVAANAHFLNAYYYLYPQGDDRPKRWLELPRIGLDIDEVLADWLNPWREKFNITNVPNSWYFDREIRHRFEALRDRNELDDFYLSLKPLIDAKDLPFEPHCYITSRPIATETTIKWLDHHGFPARPVFTVNVGESKVDVAKKAGVEIFIDDSFDNFRDFNKNKIFCYLYDKPHNRRYDVGHMRIKSLHDLPILK